MIKRIIEYFKNLKAKSKIKKIINLAYSIIFSEKYDLSTDNGVECFIKEFENIFKNRIETLQAYSLINPILYNQIPIEEIDNFQKIKKIDFVELINKIQSKIRNEEILKAELELEKAKLKVNLLIMDIYVKAGRSEFEKNEYSYAGMIYRAEKAKKAPASPKEKDEFKKLADKLNVVERQINVELDQHKTNK
ncbi:MAG: hypothetical protein IPH97_00490 [Ignavibacteriales bacterium]|nr:hypothetical protein [Ignavibacteriales bacterium]